VELLAIVKYLFISLQTMVLFGSKEQMRFILNQADSNLAQVASEEIVSNLAQECKVWLEIVSELIYKDHLLVLLQEQSMVQIVKIPKTSNQKENIENKKDS